MAEKRPSSMPPRGPRGRRGIEKPKDAKGTFIRLLGYMTDYKLNIALALLCVLISSAANVSSNYFIKPIINDFVMPLIGWVCVHTIAEKFEAFQKFIPWIALGLLLYIGGSMLREGLSGHAGDDAKGEVGSGTLFIQGIATSIDALSVGFTIAKYNTAEAVTESVIIGLVTFIICLAGIKLGKTLGTRLSGKAEILGGVILIAIGLEIFITGVF